LLESVRALHEMGVTLYGTQGTAKFLRQNGLPISTLHWPLDKKSPNAVDYIKEGKIDLVINIPKSYQTQELTNGYLIRRTAVDFGVMLITNRQIAMRFVEAICNKSIDDLKIKAADEY